MFSELPVVVDTGVHISVALGITACAGRQTAVGRVVLIDFISVYVIAPEPV